MYEAADVDSIGCAHDLVMGVKPFCLNIMDSELVTNRCERVEDIDEEA